MPPLSPEGLGRHGALGVSGLLAHSQGGALSLWSVPELSLCQNPWASIIGAALLSPHGDKDIPAMPARGPWAEGVMWARGVFWGKRKQIRMHTDCPEWQVNAGSDLKSGSDFGCERGRWAGKGARVKMTRQNQCQGGNLQRCSWRFSCGNGRNLDIERHQEGKSAEPRTLSTVTKAVMSPPQAGSCLTFFSPSVTWLMQLNFPPTAEARLWCMNHGSKSLLPGAPSPF